MYDSFDQFWFWIITEMARSLEEANHVADRQESGNVSNATISEMSRLLLEGWTLCEWLSWNCVGDNLLRVLFSR